MKSPDWPPKKKKKKNKQFCHKRLIKKRNNTSGRQLGTTAHRHLSFISSLIFLLALMLQAYRLQPSSELLLSACVVFHKLLPSSPPHHPQSPKQLRTTAHRSLILINSLVSLLAPYVTKHTESTHCSIVAVMEFLLKDNFWQFSDFCYVGLRKACCVNRFYPFFNWVPAKWQKSIWLKIVYLVQKQKCLETCLSWRKNCGTY